MTIYTAKAGEKKEPSNVPPPEVVTDNAVEKKDNDVNLAYGSVNPPTLVTVSSRARRSGCANVCVLLTALVVLAIGVVGGVYLYKHLAQRTFRGWCGVKYYEYREDERRAGRLQAHHQGGLYHNSRRYYGQFEEHVEIDKVNGKYEKIDVPDLDECRRATILHDFERNLTAIVDKVSYHCFILPLNRSAVTPPRDFWDLMDKLKNGYYLPDAELVREHYHIVYPRIVNLGPYGYHIWRECHRFDTYHLKRSPATPARLRRGVRPSKGDKDDSSSEEEKEESEEKAKQSHEDEGREVGKGTGRRDRLKNPRYSAVNYNLGSTGNKIDRLITIDMRKRKPEPKKLRRPKE